MNLVDTDKRLKDHFEGWLSMAQGRLSTLKRDYDKKSGINKEDIAWEQGHVSGLKQALGLVVTHIQQSPANKPNLRELESSVVIEGQKQSS